MFHGQFLFRITDIMAFSFAGWAIISARIGRWAGRSTRLMPIRRLGPRSTNSKMRISSRWVAAFTSFCCLKSHQPPGRPGPEARDPGCTFHWQVANSESLSAEGPWLGSSEGPWTRKGVLIVGLFSFLCNRTFSIFHPVLPSCNLNHFARTRRHES